MSARALRARGAACGFALAITCGFALALSPSPARAAIEMQATLDRNTIGPGETTTLTVVLRNVPMFIGQASGVHDPEITISPPLEIVSSGREQSFSWVNGRASNEVRFRYDVGATSTGRFALGPIRVRVDQQTFEAPALELTVTAAAGAPAAPGHALANAPHGRGAALLIADVTPRDPWVGQPVILRVRLVMRANDIEDGPYSAPTTPGFWAETPGPPRTYEALLDGQRVDVTEEHTRLYPLAPGRTVIGPGSKQLVVAESNDPFLLAMGAGQRRAITVTSAPVPVAVRALPAGAPPGFDGAVGALSVTWSADRERTAEDVPITVRFDVRGIGNLPLARAPTLDVADAEVFSSTASDSFGAPGSEGVGRRRFQWNVLPRREGPLRIDPPAFAWFDPAAGGYRRASLAPIVVTVGPPNHAGAGEPESFPPELAGDPGAPGAREPLPWAFALAGGMLAAALVLWRARPPSEDPARAQVARWRAALGDARQTTGAAFWQMAEESAGWLAARGVAIGSLATEIASARYGGGSADRPSIRRRLVDALDAALPPARRAALPRRPLAVALAVAALALAALAAPRPEDPRQRATLVAADDAARRGEVDRAADAWRGLWRAGAHRPALAARLAWAELRAGTLPQAAAWVVLGEQGPPRDPALSWVADRVRESGGLTGDRPAGPPVRPLEWALLALLAPLAAALLWPRRAAAGVALALALVAALAGPVTGLVAGRAERAVVAVSTPLAGAGVELEPGEVVRVLARRTGQVQVAAASGVEGWVPEPALLPVDGPS